MLHHYFLFVAGAMLSQLAEWSHLEVFGKGEDWDRTWWKAYGYALGIAAVEYFCSITANRHFFHGDEDRQRGFLLQVLWNCMQQLTINMILIFWVKQSYNWLHILAAVFLIAAMGLAALGTWKKNEYTSL